MLDPDFTFREPILIKTPGGRMVWLMRPFKWFCFMVLGLLALQGFDVDRSPDKSLFHPLLVSLIAFYAIGVHCVRRRIEVSVQQGLIELIQVAGVSSTILSVERDTPITIHDCSGKSGLRKIHLFCDRVKFEMLVLQDDADRLGDWAESFPEIIYRK